MRIIGKSDLNETVQAEMGSLPRSGLEVELAQLWRDLLGGGPVGRDDHFFERGGNSLDVMRLSARLEARYGVSVPLAELFASPTVAGMAVSLQAAQLAQMGAAPGPLRRLVHGEDAPLSLTQERMWLLHQLDAGGTAYSVSGVGRVQGPLSVGVLEDSLRRVVERHEALRTTFVQVDGELRQRVIPAEFTLERIDLRGWPTAEREEEAIRRLRAAVVRPFDFERGPMFRASLVQLADEECLLLIDLPHLNSDAWSLGILMDEVLQGYAAGLAGEELRLPPLEAQYRDYAVWQREWLHAGMLDRLRAYWHPQLQGLSPLELPLDHPRPPTLTYQGATVVWRLPEPLLEQLRDLALRENATLFMVMLTAFKVLLARWTGQSDIAVGTPVAGRHTPGVERLIGVFVNTLVLRTDLGGQPTFREALARVRTTAVGAFAHQDLPFAQLVADLQPARDLSRSPLVTVMFNQINVPMPPLEMAGVRLSAVDFDRGGAQFDLSGTVMELPGEERVTLEYNTALFDRPTIEALMRRFVMVLEAVATDADQTVNAISLLTAEERRQVLAWGGDVTPAPEGTVHQLFEAQVRRTPERIALQFGSTSLTYREVNAHANRLARRLQANDQQPGDVVALCLARSPEAVIAILAILKAGGAYLPLDPQHPPARLAELIEEAQPGVVLTGAPLPADVTNGVPTLEVTLDGGEEDSDDLNLLLPDEPLAYVMFTSGTTGRPKGVEGLHRGVLYRLQWMWAAYPFTEQDVCCLKTSLGFVDSVWELFGPLLAGVPLVIIPDDMVKDPLTFVEVLTRERITRLVLVPSLLSVLLEALPSGEAPSLPDLLVWSVSGEALSCGLAARFKQRLPHATLLNLYGSTEVSGDATAQEVNELDDGAFVTIGRSIQGAQCYVVDRDMHLTPPGTPGELLVGGHGLARGYHRQLELTAMHFLPNPFGLGQVYRTHDLVKWSSDGRLHWLGRLDRQLKIRGIRVDPGEVEAMLSRHPNILASAIVGQARHDDSTELIAFLVVEGVELGQIEKYLAEKLPAALVPSRLFIVDELPLTSSGKLNRSALPVPQALAGNVYKAPISAIELKLSTLWAEILELEPSTISIDVPFFDIGGHSLLAARLISRIEHEFGVRVPLAALFQTPTITALSRFLEMNKSLKPQVLVTLQSQGSRPPLFWLGYVSAAWHLARHLGADQPIYGLVPPSEKERSELGTVEAMAQLYLGIILSVQPHGPYYLAGFSFNGLIIYEIAHKLQVAGEKVILLVLLDTWPPKPADASLSLVVRRTARRIFFELHDAFEKPSQYFMNTVKRAVKLRQRFLSRMALGLYGSDSRVSHATIAAAAKYRAPTLLVPTLYIAARHARVIQPVFLWTDVLRGSFETIMIEGDHLTMLHPERIKFLGPILRERLTAALVTSLSSDGSA